MFCKNCRKEKNFLKQTKDGKYICTDCEKKKV